MSTYQSKLADGEKPFPKYLIDPVSRLLIQGLFEAGYSVALTSASSGASSVAITSPEGATRAGTGRPENLEETLRAVAAKCGCDVDSL